MAHSHFGAGSIDYYASTSGIGHWNGGLKLVLGVGTLILCVAADALWIFLFVFFTMSALTVIGGKMHLHDYLHLLTVPAVFLLFSTFALAWATDVRGAVFVACKACGALSALYMVTLSTTMAEILNALKKCHVPALIIELMHLIYRYIFVLWDAASRMNHAAASRLGYQGKKQSLRTFGQLLGNLLIISLKKANAAYDAMEARCYEGHLGFLQEEKPLDKKLGIACGAYLLFLLAAVILERFVFR